MYAPQSPDTRSISALSSEQISFSFAMSCFFSASTLRDTAIRWSWTILTRVFAGLTSESAARACASDATSLILRRPSTAPLISSIESFATLRLYSGIILPP